MTARYVVWHAPDGVPARGYWDQALLEDLFAGRLWRPARDYTWATLDRLSVVPEGAGAVVVVPGAHTDPVALSAALAPLAWVLLIVTSDEEARLDLGRLRHPRMVVWRQYLPDADVGRATPVPIGYPPGTPGWAATYSDPIDRPWRWAFAGQVTTDRRRAWLTAADELDGGARLATSGFAQGMPHESYMAEMAAARVALAPGGARHADSFRLWEALEAGCAPVGDLRSAVGDHASWWWRLTGGTAPFACLDDPGQLAAAVAAADDLWPLSGAVASAWWQQTKRALAYSLVDTVWALSGEAPSDGGDPARQITVVMPTSPIPSHPSLDVLCRTLDSLTDAGLAGAEVIITADGVRPAQAHRVPAYHDAVAQLVANCEHLWPGVLPVVHRDHQHQARMMRDALAVHVRTPLVLYVEHDTPLEGSVAWGAVAEAVTSGAADLVRFHYESRVLDAHMHLMVDGPERVAGVEMWRTMQWSQRPHLASADYYRRVLSQHFTPDERWMIEDRMHSVCEVAWREQGREGWEQHRLWVYHDDDHTERRIRRSHHIDGRQGDPKWVDQ